MESPGSILTYELLLQLTMMSLKVPTHRFYYQAVEVRKPASFDLICTPSAKRFGKQISALNSDMRK